MKISIYIFLIGFCFLSCDNGNNVKSAAKAEVETKQPTSTTEENKAKIEDLKSQILSEDDYEGRMNKGLSTLRTQYAESEGLVPNVGKVTIDLGENLDLNIKNELNGDLLETKVNLLQLNAEQGGFSLMPDKADGEFPGLRIRTINDEALIMEYKNGELVNKNNELKIFLKDRIAIEAITPAILQTLRVAKEMDAKK